MSKPNIKTAIVFATLILLGMWLFSLKKTKTLPAELPKATWQMESIDTVKYSRDLAREQASNPKFVETIDKQMKLIASTGANYVAIGTPYDKEFIPFLSEWVKSAREHNLKIWFRGNFSGWEGWFEYPKIGREEHKILLKNFIKQNGNLFMDGDIFTSCTECENGGPGDPRRTGDTDKYRSFLVEEYQISKIAFREIGKNVTSNFFPMNYDVAKLIMDKETTKLLGGVVVIDHYVATPEIMDKTIKELEKSSGGKIVLGEFGAPIPDIHGNLSEIEQSNWIEDTLTVLANNKNVVGVNYWTGFGGSTRLWKSNETPTASVKTLERYFKPTYLAGIVRDEAGNFVAGARVTNGSQQALTNTLGEFVFINPKDTDIPTTVSANEFQEKSVQINPSTGYTHITLKRKSENLSFKVRKFFFIYFGI